MNPKTVAKGNSKHHRFLTDQVPVTNGEKTVTTGIADYPDRVFLLIEVIRADSTCV